MLENFGKINGDEIVQGLQVAGIGLATVFTVLILFYALVKLLLKVFPEKGAD